MGLLLLGMGRLSAQTILHTEGFETDGEGSRYTSNTFNFCAGAPGANPDYFLRTNSNPVLPPGTCTIGFGSGVTPDPVTLCGACGTFFWASEDIRSSSPVLNANPPGNITTSSINVTGYGTLTVSLFLGTASNNNTRWESADSINIQASLNAGAFRTVGRFVGDAVAGGRLRIDANLDGVGEGATVDQSALTQYTFSIPGSGTNLRVRLDFDQLGGTEEIAVDLIQVRGNVIVPVKWASFTGHQLDDAVKLDWVTTEEVNVSTFEIERLHEEGTYTPIGTVLAKGQAGSYAFVDPNPAAGTNLYRIRQVDIDNNYTYSDVVEIHFAANFKTVLYPNPMHDGCRLAIEGDAVSGTLQLIDNTGRLLRTSTFENTQELQIERGNLPAGIYHLRLDLSNGRSFTKKLMIHD